MEKRLRRKLNVVFAWDKIGAITAEANISAGRLNERLSMRDCFARRQRLGGLIKRFWQAVTLVNIEDRLAFQKPNRLGIVPGLFGAVSLFLRNERVCVTDFRALFAFAHTPAKVQSLFKGQPSLG